MIPNIVSEHYGGEFECLSVTAVQNLRRVDAVLGLQDWLLARRHQRIGRRYW